MYRSGSPLGGEKKFGSFKVDGCYITSASNTTTPKIEIFEFLGCFYHGCPKCFEPVRWNPVLKRSMGELYGEVERRIRWFETQSYRITSLWECEFRELLKTETKLNDIYNTYQSPLKPRDAFFGGRTENFKSYWRAPTNDFQEDDYELEYVDICSLYPYVNANCVYPLGHPDEIITTNFPTNCNEVAEKYFGMVKCQVLPPEQLHIPVLPLKIKKKLFFPLCNACVKIIANQSASPATIPVSCSHSPAQRAFWGTFCTPELKLALAKGYQIINVSEVWHWAPAKQSTNLFKGYIQTFLKTKAEASGWPKEEEMGDEALAATIQAENEHLEAIIRRKRADYIANFYEKEGVHLDEQKIAKNEGLRFISKILLNSFWGYLGMRDNMEKTQYINSYGDLVNHMKSNTSTVTDVCIVNDELAIVQYQNHDEWSEPSAKTNVILAAFTTAHARTILYGYMDQLHPDQVCYCDTDSIMYYYSKSLLQRGYHARIATGEFLGDMTAELPPEVKCTEFYSAGPKFYLLSGKNRQTGEDYNIYKVKGVTLNSGTQQSINADTIKKLVLRETHELRSPFQFIARCRKKGTLVNKACKRCLV